MSYSFQLQRPGHWTECRGWSARQIRDAFVRADQIRFNVSQVLRDLGVKVDMSPSDVSGLVETIDGVAVVRVNSAESNTRQRFTMAHELGHLLLHVDPSVSKVHFRDKTYSGDAQEREANAFASDVLMPESWVRELRRVGYDAEKMAETFGVSLPAMKIRLGYLASKKRL